MTHVRPPIDRFMEKVDQTDTCWLWTGATRNGGYGSFWSGSEIVPAYRWSYEYFVSAVPDGLEVDHLCRVHECVNPAHLEAVTHRENVLRGIGPSARQAKQTHCALGHLLDDENTYRKPGTNKRECRTCQRTRELARPPRKKTALTRALSNERGRRYRERRRTSSPG